MKWPADENFPVPAYRFLIAKDFDVVHFSELFPSAVDEMLLAAARDDGRVLLTFDVT